MSKIIRNLSNDRRVSIDRWPNSQINGTLWRTVELVSQSCFERATCSGTAPALPRNFLLPKSGLTSGWALYMDRLMKALDRLTTHNYRCRFSLRVYIHYKRILTISSFQRKHGLLYGISIEEVQLSISGKMEKLRLTYQRKLQTLTIRNRLST